jgi:hypothetical protein
VGPPLDAAARAAWRRPAVIVAAGALLAAIGLGAMLLRPARATDPPPGLDGGALPAPPSAATGPTQPASASAPAPVQPLAQALPAKRPVVATPPVKKGPATRRPAGRRPDRNKMNLVKELR